MKNSLNKKLLLIGLGTLLITAFIASTAYHQISQLRQVLELANSQTTQSRLFEDYHLHIQLASQHLTNFVITGNAENQAAARGELQEADKALRILQASSLASDDAQYQTLLKKQTQMIAELKMITEQTIQIPSDLDSSERLQTLEQIFTSNQAAAEMQKEINVFINGQFNALEKSIRAAMGKMLTSILTVLSLLTLLFVGLLTLVHATVFKPIKRLMQATDQVAAGSLDQQVPETSQDEIGRLEENFNHMVRSLRQQRTELELSNQEARHARQAAEAANQAKGSFLANMSHELRTPLTVILGYSEMLLHSAQDSARQKLDERSTGRLERIYTSAQHLLNLINDILDFSKIEAGRLDLAPENFRITNLIEDIVAAVQPLMGKNHNRLEVAIETSFTGVKGALGENRFQDEIYADPTRVRQVLYNLLSNAAKFTENGVVHLRVQRSIQEDQSWLEFEVSDTGIGMTPEQVENLFQYFQQAEPSTTRKYGGTGLGLAISRRLCQMMGGSISAQSTLREGSVFHVRLPLHAPSSRQKPSAAPVAADGSAFKVLVIDDEKEVAELIADSLAQAGFEAHIACNGPDGLRMATKLHPHAITLDIFMPDMDGWSVLQALKSDASLHDIPVVIISLAAEREMGFTLGAADYLTKPIDRKQLIQTLERYRPAPPPPPENAKKGDILLVEDDPMMCDLLQSELGGAGWQMRLAENGRRGLEMLAAAAPDLILLDLLMPEMDGFQFVQVVQGEAAWQKLPIIVITAMDLSAEQREALNGFVQHILYKGNGRRTPELLEDLKRLLAERLQPASQGAE